MPIVQLPKEFFKQERQQLYANWPIAFWRELVQNATDAGSSVITISLQSNEDGEGVIVQFGDDGPGITREVMETVYFRLGATTKGGPRNATRLGGFGRARILTCFSMARYAIRTQNLVVTGEGADYTIAEVGDGVAGCHLTIEIDDCSLRDMTRALHVFLRQSQLGCQVVVNDMVWSEWAMRGALVTKLICNDFAFASVYVQSSGLLNHVVVRSKGVQTFFQTSRVPMQVIIEIEPSLLRTVLTGNRDGMLSSYRSALDTFLEEMTLNSSALQRKRFRSDPVRLAAYTFSSTYGLQTNRVDLGTDPTTIEAPDVFVFNESDDVKVAKTVKTYLPDNWNDEKRQAMMTWKVACQMAVDVLLKITRTSRLDWAVGWYFGDPLREAVTKRKGGLCIFCLNPLDAASEFRFAPKNANDRRRILALAAHEVTHGKIFGHDEEFASLFTEIVAILDQQEYHKTLITILVQRADAYAWSRESYLLGLSLLRSGEGLPAVMAALPDAKEGQINRKYHNDPPDEALLDEPIIIGDGDEAMTYLELWKIGHALYGETWKKELTIRFGLSRTRIQWNEPTFLTPHDRRLLRDDWREEAKNKKALYSIHKTAKKLLDAIEEAGPVGMTQEQLMERFPDIKPAEIRFRRHDLMVHRMIFDSQCKLGRSHLLVAAKFREHHTEAWKQGELTV